jgi:hypothetical protein
MSRRHLPLAACLLLAGLAPRAVRADDPPPSPFPTTEALVAGLHSPDASVREQAATAAVEV